MKTIIFSLLYSFCTTQVQSDANFDYFVMSEAHILERRVNEDANAGYPPFHMECFKTETRSSCFPVIPHLDTNEGYIITTKSDAENQIYYGCLKKTVPSNEFNPQHYKKALTMKQTAHFEPFLYNQRCTSEISPTIWKTELETPESVLQSYQIGFVFDSHFNMPIAEVHYNQKKRIPLYAKHTLHGGSLAAPIVAFKTTEELIYEEDSMNFTAEDLQEAIQIYYRFNDENSDTRSDINSVLKRHGLNTIPQQSKMSLAHLIPEYDIIETSWKNISRFAQTIAPMWTDLYINEWAEVENKIREVAFINDKKLTVVSGTHGQPTFNFTPSKMNPNGHEIFFLNFLFVRRNPFVPVPQLFWKLVIDETDTEQERKNAIVIILYNITEELARLNIFRPFQPPCESKCNQFRWYGIEKPNLIYCCEVEEVKNIIKEFPDDVRNKNFDPFVNTADKILD